MQGLTSPLKGGGPPLGNIDYAACTMCRPATVCTVILPVYTPHDTTTQFTTQCAIVYHIPLSAHYA